MLAAFNLTLGPVIIGTFFAVFLFGVITMQMEDYIRNHFRNDLLFVKYFVVGLWFTHLLFTIFICGGAYAMSVTDFGHTIELLFIPWSLNAAIIIGNVIDHAVQAFFVTRVYRVTGALYVSIGLWTMVAFLQAIGLKLAQESIGVDSIVLVRQNSSWLFFTLFFGDACLDVVMSLVLICYLKQQSWSVFERTATLLNRLVRYTIQTGLATSFVAVATALSFKFWPNNYIWTAFMISLPGSFTIALLANINARRGLIQPQTVIMASNATESAVVIDFSRSVVHVRDPVDLTRPEHHSEDRVTEQAKRSGEHTNDTISFSATSSDTHAV
ncbi:hypothetical protein DFH06DRAFT_1486413 [Mycena polygramma]|nr:hypothetical protein DFH06DRAFT_1486413 [Mycena polygramma]